MVFPAMAQLSYQLEFYGGYAFLNPADLNLNSDYRDKTTSFFYDDYYEYYNSMGLFSNIRKEKNGEFAKLKSAFPFGGRFKVLIGENFAVSLGVDYFSKTASSSPSFRYDYVQLSMPRTKTQDFTEYELYAKALNPNVFLHYIAELGAAGAEIYAGAGLLFTNCSAYWVYTNRYERLGFWEEGKREFKSEGSGKGYSFHAGGG